MTTNHNVKEVEKVGLSRPSSRPQHGPAAGQQCPASPAGRSERRPYGYKGIRITGGAQELPDFRHPRVYSLNRGTSGGQHRSSSPAAATAATPTPTDVAQHI
jgi:hypothetical protein